MPTTQFASDITFSLEGVTIHATNIVFGAFTNSIPAHSHGAGCYEIHYISAGLGTLETGGISDATIPTETDGPHAHAPSRIHTITPGILYVTGPNIAHAQLPDSENPMQEYCIYLKLPKHFVPTAETPLLNQFTAFPFWFGEDTQGIQSLFEILFTEYHTKSTGYQTQIKLLLIQILIMLVRNYEQSTAPKPKTEPIDLNTRKTLIIEGYFLNDYRNASLTELSARIGLSPRQTQRLLQEYYNKTFRQKKTESRMSAAIILLQDKEKSIADIADALGYSSPEHFSGAFKAYYHKSPREYRRI